MKFHTTIICGWIYLCCLYNCPAQETTSTQTSEPLLDDSRPAKAIELVDRAFKERHYESLLIAMHNLDYDVQLHCLARIESLPKLERCKLLAKILLDDKLLVRKSAPLFSGILEQQIQLQFAIEQMAYKTLNLPAPNYHGLLTREEAESLADKLQIAK